jgi:predicted DNA-binding protein with PD1-like motif
MKTAKEKDFYLVVLDKGEEIIATLTAFAAREKIEGAAVFGIGGVTNVTLGFFDRVKKEYLKKTLTGFYELTSLVGNISMLSSKHFCHLHAVVSGADMASSSGHLFAATVSLTAEIFIRPLTRIEREFSSEIGLNLIRLSD